jgi:hypothetical protein
VIEKGFADRDAALMWIIQTQLGRRNLTTYQKGELALRFEPLLKAQAKERQATSTGGKNPQLVKNPAQADSVGRTRKKIADIAGVSHDTIEKIKKLATSADAETKQRLRRGDVSINRAYTDLMYKEHDGETKVCEHCQQEKPVKDFSIHPNRHRFSELCTLCEAEVKRAAKAAAKAAAQAPASAETQPTNPATPIPGMAMHNGAPVHVRTPLPDSPDMFAQIVDLVEFAGKNFLANLETAMQLYTSGMASQTNGDALIALLDSITTKAEEIIDNRLEALEEHE